MENHNFNQNKNHNFNQNKNHNFNQNKNKNMKKENYILYVAIFFTILSFVLLFNIMTTKTLEQQAQEIYDIKTATEKRINNIENILKGNNKKNGK